MHENRTTYSPKKTQMYQQIQSLPKKYRVLALVKLDKVRGAQILPLRKTLKDDVLFVNIKDRVAKKALQGLDIPGVAGIAKELVVPEQEITEAACLIAVVRRKRIPTPRMLGVADIPYVLGLLDAIGEMKRLTLDMMRSGRTGEAERIFEITVEMYDELAGFAVYGNSVKDVRKKIDVARITIDGMRSVVAGVREGGAPLQ